MVPNNQTNPIKAYAPTSYGSVGESAAGLVAVTSSARHFGMFVRSFVFSLLYSSRDFFIGAHAEIPWA